MKPSGLLLSFLFLLSTSVPGQIFNRSFEQAVEPNATYFTPPLGWKCENYAGIHTGPFEPNNSHSGGIKWTIPDPNNEGDYYLVLSTGDLGPDSDPLIKKASASQRLYLPAGTRIQGEYFFGTCDYRPYYDFGEIDLIPAPCDPNNPNDPNSPCDPNAPHYSGKLTSIQLARCSVADVGDFGSTERWISFSRTLLPREEGIYDLILRVEDGTDTIFESYLAVDDLAICGPQTPVGDMSCDCTVNLQDLSLLSRAWLETCPTDPNIINDPNCLSVYADFSKDGKVDANDLDLFRENWLLTGL